MRTSWILPVFAIGCGGAPFTTEAANAVGISVPPADDGGVAMLASPRTSVPDEASVPEAAGAEAGIDLVLHSEAHPDAGEESSVGSSSGATSVCGATNCAGCCDRAGVCQPQADGTCGTSGAACVDCTQTGQTCGAGSCVAVDPCQTCKACTLGFTLMCSAASGCQCCSFGRCAAD